MIFDDSLKLAVELEGMSPIESQITRGRRHTAADTAKAAPALITDNTMPNVKHEHTFYNKAPRFNKFKNYNKMIKRLWTEFGSTLLIK